MHLIEILNIRVHHIPITFKYTTTLNYTFFVAVSIAFPLILKYQAWHFYILPDIAENARMTIFMSLVSLKNLRKHPTKVAHQVNIDVQIKAMVILVNTAIQNAHLANEDDYTIYKSSQNTHSHIIRL